MAVRFVRGGAAATSATTLAVRVNERGMMGRLWGQQGIDARGLLHLAPDRPCGSPMSSAFA